MKKYRLKDKELQKKLDDLTDGDFSKRLSAEGERMEIMTNCGRIAFCGLERLDGSRYM